MSLFYIPLLVCAVENEDALKEREYHPTKPSASAHLNPGPSGPWAGPNGLITWDFEASNGGFVAPPEWFCTGGWGWDKPSNGPGSAHSGSYCWGTSPDGPSYDPNANWILATPAQNFSTLTNPILKFWHWYDTESGYDTCRLEISTNGGGSWTELAKWAGYGASWQEVTVNLSAYAGRPSVIIRWRLTSDGTVQYDGWFIDDVRILDGPTGTVNLYATSYENNNGDLTPVTIAGGATAPWERGTISSGPGGAYDGTRCWATNRSGDYNNNADEAIQKGTSINASGYSYLEINFWQWYSTETSFDSGWVEVSTDGGASWIKASPSYRGSSGAWVRTTLNLSSYISSQFKFRFRFKSDGSVVYPGWYIDSVRVTAGTVTTFRSWDFEADSGNYTANPAATRTNINEWEWGAPPGAIGAHSGTRCWGTDLDNTYENSVSMILQAPVQNVSAWPRVILDFWHWRDAESYDTSIVEVSSDGGTTWNRVAEYTARFRSWQAETLNVSQYKSANFTFRFILKTDGTVSDTGWYVDDVELDTIPPSMVPITADPIYVSNGYLACYIRNATDGFGTITAATDSLHPRGKDISLLYGGASHSPWSSYITVRSHRSNTDFVSRYTSCTTQSGYSVAYLQDYFLGSYKIKGNEDSVVTIWDGLPDNLRVEQHIYVIGTSAATSRIQVMTKVINKSNQTRTVSVRYEWDIHIFDTDAPYLRGYRNGGWTGWYGYETKWWGDSIALYYEENQDRIAMTPFWHYISCKWAPWPPDPLDPDTFFYMRWPTAYSSAFPANYMVDGIRDSLPRYNDDCVVFMWVNRTIPAHDSLIVVEYLWSPNQPLYEDVKEPEVPGKPFVGLAGPNPLRPGDEISFGLSGDQMLELKLYSVDGRLVKTLVSGKTSGGVHSLCVPMLPSGAYFLIMDAERDGRFARKLLIQR